MSVFATSAVRLAAMRELARVERTNAGLRDVIIPSAQSRLDRAAASLAEGEAQARAIREGLGSISTVELDSLDRLASRHAAFDAAMIDRYVVGDGS